MRPLACTLLELTSGYGRVGDDLKIPEMTFQLKPRLARSRCGDPGPRQEGQEPKLPWNRRGIGRAS